MEIFLDKFLGQIFNALAGAIITLLWTMLRAKKRENDALKEGVQALLRDRIIQAYNHYSDKGWIPIYAMESIEACYKSYEELGEFLSTHPCGVRQPQKRVRHYLLSKPHKCEAPI